MKLIKAYFKNRALYKKYRMMERKKDIRIDNVIIALYYMQDWDEFHPSGVLAVCKILNIEKNKASYRFVKDLYNGHINCLITEELIKRIPLYGK